MCDRHVSGQGCHIHDTTSHVHLSQCTCDHRDEWDETMRAAAGDIGAAAAAAERMRAIGVMLCAFDLGPLTSRVLSWSCVVGAVSAWNRGMLRNDRCLSRGPSHRSYLWGADTIRSTMNVRGERKEGNPLPPRSLLFRGSSRLATRNQGGGGGGAAGTLRVVIRAVGGSAGRNITPSLPASLVGEL